MTEDREDEFDLPTVECPACGNEFHVCVASAIPDEQKTTIKITSESRFISADVIGQAIICQSKVLKQVAKNQGVTVSVFVCRMTCEPGLVELEFLITVTNRKD